MRIAWLTCPENPVPPTAYGGAELCTDIWVRRLMELHHEVDLYAGPGSTCPASRVFEAPTNRMSDEPALLQMLFKGQQGENGYDVVIDYSAMHLAGQTFKNVVSIMGGDPYRKYPHQNVRNKVYISRSFAEFWHAPTAPVIHNPAQYSKGDALLSIVTMYPPHALYVGVIHPMKGLEIAVHACKQLGMPLHVYGPIRNEAYWKAVQEIGGVHYCGMLERDPIRRDEVFGRAGVFLHPTQVCDAYPIAPREAALRGTPVVACPLGGIREFIQPHFNGQFAQTVPEYVDAITEVLSYSRLLVRDTSLAQEDSRQSAEMLSELCVRVENGGAW